MSRFTKLSFALSLFALVSCADRDTTTEPSLDPSFSRNPHEASELLEGQIPAAVPMVSKVIGKAGGVLVISGGVRNGHPTFHSLTVPAGVLKEDLLFTMELGTQTYIDVELKAYRVKNGERGEEVGHRGFAKPLYLTLSYAWADKPFNPAQLGIVYVQGNEIKERVRSFRIPNGKFLIGEIRHFSRYSIAT